MSSLNISLQAHIASQSVILGDVTIGADSSVFYYAVVRGDEASITIGRRSNIQDNSTVHVDYGFPTVIGDDVTVGHNCVIHGCTIGDASLIGMGSTILTVQRLESIAWSVPEVWLLRTQLFRMECWLSEARQK